MGFVAIIGKIKGDEIGVMLPPDASREEIEIVKEKLPEIKLFSTLCFEMDDDEFEKYIRPVLDKVGIKWHKNAYSEMYEVYLQEV